MLGLKYMVAKSKELSTKLDITGTLSKSSSSNSLNKSEESQLPPAITINTTVTTTSASAAANAALNPHGPTQAGMTSQRREGQEFLKVQAAEFERVLTQHDKLVTRGNELADTLAGTRKKLLDEVESEQYLSQNFHLVHKVREQIAQVRGMVANIALQFEDVEQILMQRTEEYMAAQNAAFASQLQHELEVFEERILEEKEDRKRLLLEERRQLLAQTFQNDLKTYQTLVSYQGESKLLSPRTDADAPTSIETLESIDLVVAADESQLDAFYASGSESEADASVQSPIASAKLPTISVVEDAGEEALLDEEQEEEKDEENSEAENEEQEIIPTENKQPQEHAESEETPDDLTN